MAESTEKARRVRLMLAICSIVAFSGCASNNISYVKLPAEPIADTVKVTLIRHPHWMQSTMAYPVFDNGRVYDGAKLLPPGDGWYTMQRPAGEPFKSGLAKEYLKGDTQVGEIGSEGTLSWVRKPGRFQIKLFAPANPHSLFFVSDEFFLNAGKEYVFAFSPGILNNGWWRSDSDIWLSIDVPFGSSPYTAVGKAVSEREFGALMASHYAVIRRGDSAEKPSSIYLSVIAGKEEVKVFFSRDSRIIDLPFISLVETRTFVDK